MADNEKSQRDAEQEARLESDRDRLWLREQIAIYETQERPHYIDFSRLLEALLHRAKQAFAPAAIVHARTKETASFAEKCLRRSKRPGRPVYELNDLCGARIIVHTTQQLPLISDFIEQTFDLAHDPEDTGIRLNTGEFGYRSIHFIVQLPSDLGERVELTDAERGWFASATHGRKRRGEIQVRTLMQHVWADNVHDRFYKTRLQLPEEYRRETARLAAVLEAADNGFSELVQRVDALQTNYGAYLDEEALDTEIQTLQTLLAQPSLSQAQGAKLALRLARVARSLPDWELIIDTLRPYTGASPELDLEFGGALCKCYEAMPQSAEFKAGQDLLRHVISVPITDLGSHLHGEILSNVVDEDRSSIA